MNNKHDAKNSDKTLNKGKIIYSNKKNACKAEETRK